MVATDSTEPVTMTAVGAKSILSHDHGHMANLEFSDEYEMLDAELHEAKGIVSACRAASLSREDMPTGAMSDALFAVMKMFDCMMDHASEMRSIALKLGAR